MKSLRFAIAGLIVLTVGLFAVANGAGDGEADSVAAASPTAQKAVTRPVPASRSWALLIGVEGYQHVPKLQFCADDCQLLADALVEKCGFDRSRILLVSDTQTDTSLHPTRVNILAQLDRWLARPKKGDTLFMFFSGHGIDEKGTSYLVPIECNGRDLEKTAVSTTDLMKYLARCRADWTVLFIDACHSGSGMSPQLWDTLSKTDQDPRLVTLASSGMGQVSHEDPAIQHGVFAHFLVEGLRGQADARLPSRLNPAIRIGNDDGSVTLTEAYNYTFDRVSDWAVRNRKKQSPKFIAQYQGNLVLAPAVVPPPTPANPNPAPPPLQPPREMAAMPAPIQAAVQGPARPPGPCAMPDGLMGVHGSPIDPVTRLPLRAQRLKDGAVMVLVPAGRFTMGTRYDQVQAIQQAFPELKAKPLALRDERPEHPVYLSAYYIDRTEVTGAGFQKFATATGYRTAAETGFKYKDRQLPPCAIVDDGLGNARPVPGASWRSPDGPGSALKPDEPVGCIAWDDAAAYAKWVGGYLPSEAQWEKAARGTDARLFPWGNLWNDAACNVGRLDPASGRIVGAGGDGFLRWNRAGFYAKAASPYGCLDMAGNQWEWCRDFYRAREYQLQAGQWRNPQGPLTGQLRVLRGGSWAYLPAFARCAARWRGLPQVPYSAHGFRVVMLPKPL